VHPLFSSSSWLCYFRSSTSDLTTLLFKHLLQQWYAFALPSLFLQAHKLTFEKIFDKIVGLAMLIAASVVFLYYTIWTLVMVRANASIYFIPALQANINSPLSTRITLSKTSFLRESGLSGFPLSLYFWARLSWAPS